MKYTALFCRRDSDYKLRQHWDVYDVDRDALTYDGDGPIVCHPPCRFWGRLSHMAGRSGKMTAKQIAKEKSLAPWSVDRIRRVGGILEHPSGSKIFDYLPAIGETDFYGGFVIEIDQYDFGHVAHKKTKLYIVGVSPEDLPPLPPKDNTIHYCEKGKRRSITGNIAGTTRCTQKQREYTPEDLIDWFEKVIDRMV
jgi:hypothetical protein